MSLDVLLEAADVLEKQKVASILTSMHEYDKSYIEKTEIAYSMRMEKNAHYRSPQHDSMSTAAPDFTDASDVSDHPPASPSDERPQYCLPQSRRFTATKLTHKNVDIVNSNNNSPTEDDTADDSNVRILSETYFKMQPGKLKPLRMQRQELYNFKVESENSREARPPSISSNNGESWHTRSIHNQMEKNRRAQLRVFMNNLRDVIPSGPNRRKLTTLTLLQNSRAYIESLKTHEEQYEHDKQKLWQRHLRLREFLCQLSGSSVLTLPGIPITPGIRKWKFSASTPEPDSNHFTMLCDEDLKEDADLSDESDDQSIGTFSNSDGGEISPAKEML